MSLGVTDEEFNGFQSYLYIRIIWETLKIVMPGLHSKPIKVEYNYFKAPQVIVM